MFKRTAAALYRDDCFGWSAELAYYFFFALFTTLLFLVALLPYLPLQFVFDGMLTALARIASPDVVALAQSQVNQVTAQPHRGLMTIGIVGAVWSMSSGITALIDTLNQAYHVPERRPWWQVRLVAIGLVFLLLTFVLSAFALLLTGPAFTERTVSELRLGPAVAILWTVAEWPVAFVLVMVGVSLVYYIAPDVEQRWLWITPGSAAATLVWLLMSLGLRWYAWHFATYQKTFGAIGGVLVVLLWLFYSGLALVFGAELNATLKWALVHGEQPKNSDSSPPTALPRVG